MVQVLSYFRYNPTHAQRSKGSVKNGDGQIKDIYPSIVFPSYGRGPLSDTFLFSSVPRRPRDDFYWFRIFDDVPEEVRTVCGLTQPHLLCSRHRSVHLGVRIFPPPLRRSEGIKKPSCKILLPFCFV